MASGVTDSDLPQHETGPRRDREEALIDETLGGGFVEIGFRIVQVSRRHGAGSRNQVTLSLPQTEEVRSPNSPFKRRSGAFRRAGFPPEKALYHNK